MPKQSQRQLMINTLRYLSKFNLGDDLELRIRKTLIKVNACAHAWTMYERPNYCIYCNRKRSKR